MQRTALRAAADAKRYLEFGGHERMSETQIAPDVNSKDIELLLAILAELGEELQKRRDPEYVFTAAAVVSFGAVSWGSRRWGRAASLAPFHDSHRLPWLLP
jgi:hypothetical protein